MNEFEKELLDHLKSISNHLECIATDLNDIKTLTKCDHVDGNTWTKTCDWCNV